MHRYEEDYYPQETKGIDWVQGTRDGHGEDDVLDIEDFHRSLKTAEVVYLAGAFSG